MPGRARAGAVAAHREAYSASGAPFERGSEAP